MFYSLWEKRMGYWRQSHSKIAAVRYCSENEPRVYICSRVGFYFFNLLIYLFFIIIIIYFYFYFFFSFFFQFSNSLVY